MDSLTAGRLNADNIETAWHGAVTGHETPALREQLFDLLDTSGATSLSVDVRDVASIGRSGIAVLIGARRRSRRSMLSSCPLAILPRAEDPGQGEPPHQSSRGPG